MTGVRRSMVARAFRRVALPLATYYTVTLALPLANGATPSGAFIEHALILLVVPPIAIVLGCVVHTVAYPLVRLWNITSRYSGEHRSRCALSPSSAKEPA
jgi:hypothetical protein